jgi:excisionase family DNA binding protein
MRTWLNVSEAAEYAGVSRDTIDTACGRRELQNARLSGRRAIRIRPQWIDAWLTRQQFDAILGVPEPNAVPKPDRWQPS